MDILRVLFKTNDALLTTLYGNVDEAFYLREMMRLSGMGSRGAQKGLKELLGTDLITRSKRNGKYFYQANKENPLFKELRSMVSKVSLEKYPSVLSAALKPLRSKIHSAFVFGSVAQNTARPDSDIDLMIVGDTALSEVVPRLKKAESKLHREINPIVYSEAEFRERLNANNHFVRSVARGDKVFVVGEQNAL